MIRNILLALDPDNDTPVAIRYTLDVAHRYGAHVTGLACVDTKRIEESATGGGIGSMYYAEKLREKLEAKTRERAMELLDEFASASERERITYHQEVKEGSPSVRIIEDMRYHELLVIGNDPHFFYGHPDQHTTTLAHVVKGCVAPVLVVPDEFRPIKTVLLTYDGSTPAARAMQMFALYSPFGKDVDVHVIGVYEQGHEAEAELNVSTAAKYLATHGYSAHTATLQGRKPFDHIVQYAENVEADLLVAGAHSVSKMKKLIFGSTTESLITEMNLPIFLES